MLLTVREAARLLDASDQQIYRWVDDGEIPCQSVRGQARFNRTHLLEWAIARRLPISLSEFDAGLAVEDRAPSLARALRAGGVYHDVPAPDRESALRAVLEHTPLPPSLERDFVLAILLARQGKNGRSPAIGGGIVIPHARQPIVAPGANPALSVSYLDRPVRLDDSALEPATTVCLIVSPTVRAHLQMLAHLARALLQPSFRSAIARRAPTEPLAAEAERLEAVQYGTPPDPASWARAP
jgi:PTS system nitrogen regulatory IIA component